MYFIVGKTINQRRQVVSYLITDGEGIKEVALQQVYIEYLTDRLPYLKGINSNTGEVNFKNIDNSLIPTFYNGRGISNSVSVLKILEENNRQIGVRVLVASGKILNVRLSDIIKLVNNKEIQLFNAKLVNNKIVMKYAETVVTETSGGNEEVTINNYDKNKFIIGNNLMLIKYTGNDKKVIIPKGVTSIGESAFAHCESLISITIPDSVTSIGDEAFINCTGLTDIVIPNSVKSIGESTFANCTWLTNITISDSLTCIPYRAFENCVSLTNIIIPASVKGIGNFAFAYCESLKSITFSSGGTYIGGNGVFHECPNICIKGSRFSEARTYARKNNIKFEMIS